MGFVVVPRRMLGPVHGGHDDVADAHHHMQAAAQLVIPQQPHDLIEQPLLALQPVHRGVAELLVHRVQVEIDRLAPGDHLAQQVLQVIPQRIIQVRGQLMGRLPLVDDVPHLAVDRPRPAEITQQPRVRLLDLDGLPVLDLRPQLRAAQQVRGQRPHDRPFPDLHPLLHQDQVREPLARLHDDLGPGQALLRHIGIDRILMSLEILQPPQVHRLARAQLAHDDPHHRVISPGRQVTISRITAEIDELADQILDIGPRPIRVPERPHRVQPTPPARHPSLPTRIVTPGKSKSQQILSRGVLGPAYLRQFFTSVRTVATLSVPRHSPADGLPLKCAQSACPS